MATSEIDYAHGLPRDIFILSNELQKGIHYVGKQITSNRIQSKSAQSYSCRVLQHVNREEEELDRQKKNRLQV